MEQRKEIVCQGILIFLNKEYEDKFKKICKRILFVNTWIIQDDFILMNLLAFYEIIQRSNLRFYIYRFGGW